MGFAWRRAGLVGLALLAMIALPAAAQQKPTVRIGVGGITGIPYLPVVLAKELGEFDKAGVNVELIAFKGGSVAAAAVISGGAEVASGYYDHTIQFAAKNKQVKAFVLGTRLPGLVLFVAPKYAAEIKSVKDLAGKRVGVTAPGSSTDFMLKFALKKAGVDPASVAVVGVGDPSTAVAAIEQGAIHAAVNVEPAVAVLQSKHPDLKLLVDTRAEKDTRALFGSDYPSAVLYAQAEWIDKNQAAVQAMATAMVATLRWIHGHSAEEIAAKMPKDIVGADPALYLTALKGSMESFSPDGLITANEAKASLELLKDSVPEVAGAKIDLAQTFTNQYVEAAQQKLGPAPK